MWAVSNRPISIKINHYIMIRTFTNGFYNSIIKNKGTNPITLPIVKAHLGVDLSYTTDDDYLTSLIQVATQMTEDWIGADVLPTENTLVVFDFEGVTLMVEDGNYLSGLTISGTATNFEVYESISEFKVVFDSYINNTLTLHYYTGFNNIPVVIKQAILIKVADLYDIERNNYTTNSYKNNNVFEMLLSYYKKW